MDIKKLLSLYFSIDQIWNINFDKRYLVFLTSVLKEIKNFPDEIRILNWNYDYQFQMACEVFSKNSPLLVYYPGMTKRVPKVEYETTDYSLVHL